LSLSGTRKQHDVLVAVGDPHADQLVAFAQLQCNDAIRARTRERRQRRLLDGPEARREEHELVVLIAFDRQNGRYALAILER
jgi:hypothetical protein